MSIVAAIVIRGVYFVDFEFSKNKEELSLILL